MRRLVLVKWLDSAQPIVGWQFIENYEPCGPIECSTVGFLISEENDCLSVAQSVGDPGGEFEQVNGVMRIPNVCVVMAIELAETDRPGIGVTT